MTGNSFEYPEDFDPEKKLSEAFDMVFDNPIEARIWFSADQAKYVKERRFARRQKIIDQPDGSIILEMKTSGWWDVKRWVLGYGKDAVVLEPEKLRGEIREELKSQVKRYSGARNILPS
jgi:predicted DNA-binding transcriptional regulator YafY